MRGAFGKPQGTVARVHIGQVIMSIRTKAQNKEHVVEALRRAKFKFPGRQKVPGTPPDPPGGVAKKLDPPYKDLRPPAHSRPAGDLVESPLSPQGALLTSLQPLKTPPGPPRTPPGGLPKN